MSLKQLPDPVSGMNIREGSSVLKFSDDSTFSASELSFIVLHVATNRMD